MSDIDIFYYCVRTWPVNAIWHQLSLVLMTNSTLGGPMILNNLEQVSGIQPGQSILCRIICKYVYTERLIYYNFYERLQWISIVYTTVCSLSWLQRFVLIQKHGSSTIYFINYRTKSSENIYKTKTNKQYRWSRRQMY